MALYKLTAIGVLCQDGRHIQQAPGERDWQEYLKWRETNTPDPIEPEPPPTKDQIDTAAAKADAEIQALTAFTPAQARAWVIANVNTLADARAQLARFAAVLCVLARRL